MNQILELFPQKAVLSVGELTRIIKDLLEDNLRDIWVDGEISNHKKAASGHTYFTLKDETAQIRVVLFKQNKKFIPFKLEDGQRVIVKGYVTVYEPRGEYQILAQYIEPKGIGALQLAFEQLKEKLNTEGLFDPKHKKPIPPVPQTIGVITSPTGAAIRDILRIIKRRFANVRILIYPVKVQGEGAAEEIVRGLKIMNQLGEAEVLIIGRGGGSLEDLWAFNEEIVARAVFDSSIPIISAVGHEIDFTISDFVADLRAPTPSAAAELVVKNKEDLLHRLDSLTRRLEVLVLQKLTLLRHRLDNCLRRRPFSHPLSKIRVLQQRVDDMSLNLGKNFARKQRRFKERYEFAITRFRRLSPQAKLKALRHRSEQAESNLKARMNYLLNLKSGLFTGLIGKLESLSPLNILARGYSICYRSKDRHIIKEATLISPGEQMEIKLHRGNLLCEVEKVILHENSVQ